MVVLSFAILLLRAATALQHKDRVLTSRDLMGMGESKEILPSPQGDKALFKWYKYFNTTNSQERSQQLINHETGHRVNLTALDLNGERNNYQWLDNNTVGFSVQKGDHFQFWALSETQSSQYKAKQLVNVSIESVVNVKYNSGSKILHLTTRTPVNKKDVATFDSASICDEAPFENSGIPKVTRLYGVRVKGDGVIATELTNFSDYINLEPKQKIERFENSQDGTLMSLVIVEPINYFQNKYVLKVFDVNQLKIIDSFELGDNKIYTHAISPNNQIIAYTQDTDSLIDQSFRLIKLYDLNKKSSTVINQDWGNIFQRIAFSNDQENLIITSMYHGKQNLYKYNLADKKFSLVYEYGFQTLLETFSDGTIQSSASTTQHPNKLLKLTPKSDDKGGYSMEVLPLMEDIELQEFDLQPYEPFYFTGARKDNIHGYMIKPKGFDPTKKYPLMVLVHGGPAGTTLDIWDEFYGPQLFSQAGFVVVDFDYHGSVGYNLNFTQSVNFHWGDLPHLDIIAGVRHVINKNPFIDENKVAARGHSFGGYLLNYMNGHNEDNLFKAFVVYDGIFNLINFYYTSSNTKTTHMQLGSFPFENINLPINATMNPYIKFSPSTYVSNWNTPTLVVHSKNDYTTHESEGIGAFTALQSKGIPSKLLYFTDEGHFIAKQANNIRFHDENLRFISDILNHELPYDLPPFYV